MDIKIYLYVTLNLQAVGKPSWLLRRRSGLRKGFPLRRSVKGLQITGIG